MDDEQVRLLCGDGEPIDIFTAASLGLIQYFVQYSVIDYGKYESNMDNDTLPQKQQWFSKDQKFGWSALMYAIYYRRKNVIKLLMSFPQYSHSERALATPWSGMSHSMTTPLNLAVLCGDLTSVQLLQPGSDLNLQDNRNKTALYWAVETNQPKIAEFFLIHGASPNILCNGTSCLGVAARQGNTILVELLLKHEAEVCLREQTVMPLTLSLESGNLQTASLLLTNIRDKHGFEEILKQLNLEKYLPALKRNNINYQKFLEMTETDIKNCGISLLGPRKKLALLISLLKVNFSPSAEKRF